MRQRFVEWPPRSLNRIPLDLLLFAYLKSKVYEAHLYKNAHYLNQKCHGDFSKDSPVASKVGGNCNSE